MKTSFIYTGIRVKDMKESIDFYTKVLGMKLIGKSKIPIAKGDVANLITEGGEFSLELNHYSKASNTTRGTSSGRDWTTSRSGSTTSTG